MTLRRLSYRSVRVPGQSDEELLTGLILPSAERNRRAGVTGCLWTGDHSFVQVIEGEDRVVHDLMARIVNDPRHRSVKMLMNCSARMRLFPTWTLKWVKQGQCCEVDGLADAIAQRTPKPEPLVATDSCEAMLKPTPSRMAQIVIALVSAESELP